MATHGNAGCCHEYGCDRSMPILVRPGPLSGGWFAVTKYRPLGGGAVEAQEKHRLDPQSEYEIELNGSVIQALFEFVKDAYHQAVPGEGDAESAYRKVLDELDSLAGAKRGATLDALEEADAVGTAGLRL